MRFEGLGAALGQQGQERAVRPRTKDAADAGNGDAGDVARHASGWPSSEEKFVVFAAVESLLKGCAWADG
jgi:hypothetical protein